jgi:hypothetical protein
MTVKTDTVTFHVGNGVRITAQPQPAAAPDGEIVRASVTATGDGLTYQWYIQNAGGSKFSKSSVTTAEYACRMNQTADGRQAYCVITDRYGISVRTETITLTMRS